MKLFEETVTLRSDVKRAVALGNFDGLHMGHQKLIEVLIQKARENHLESCVYTFKNHTLPTINGQAPPVITSLVEKCRLLETYQLNSLILDDFNEDMMNLSPEDFVQKILVETLQCQVAVIGFDYRFGSKAKGNAQLLKQLGEKHGFKVFIIDPVTIEDEKISSTAVRKYISQGKIQKANQFLGRYFSKYGRVIHGKGRGNTMGFPTANVEIEPHLLLPQEGVYATFVKIKGQLYLGATSVGKNPTFNGNQVTLEAHVIDFTASLYDCFIEVFFVEKLRDNIKFEGKETLMDQLTQDIENSKKILELAGSFQMSVPS